MTRHARSIACVFALSAAVFAPQFVSAASPGENPEQAPRIEINVSKIDLTSTQGTRLVQRQIGKAARTLCIGVTDPNGLNIRNAACIQAARTQANRQLDGMRQSALALAAKGNQPVELARTDTPKPVR
jgi:UrcA family protein